MERYIDITERLLNNEVVQRFESHVALRVVKSTSERALGAWHARSVEQRGFGFGFWWCRI